jgi:putative transposase
MNEDSTVVRLRQPEDIDDPLTAVLRSGARRLLAQAIESEAVAFLALMADRQLDDGRARFVRHGRGPERTVQTGIGPVAVQRVKVRDRDPTGTGEQVRFTSAILPRCCPSSTCAASRPVTSKKRSPPFWARTRRTCHRRCSGG